MSESIQSAVRRICGECGRDRGRMMDVVRAVQAQFGSVPNEAMDLIARELSVHRVEVEGVVSFYSFFSDEPKGRIVIRLCNDVIDKMKGASAVEQAFSEALGIGVGETTPDGAISLEHTPCIGMCDQAPAALVNNVVVTSLNRDKARDIVETLRRTGRPESLVSIVGDGNNAHPLVRAMVFNNIRRRGTVIFGDGEPNAGLTKALAMSPAEVIRDVKTARLRGRGGAGFPTGMKWDFTRQAAGPRRFVLCNADEGEPGTFKDRVLLTECPDLMFEGMTIAGYAIGADTGILYLRAEYAYLAAFLNDVLEARRKKGLLGQNAAGKKGFHFDIRIQLGAGAYICGEETALISSCEGQRGDPKNRPPFPAQKGYLGAPTTVNNVETFCCVTRILDKGPGWFAQIGTKGSAGTKLLSVSGDCWAPGVYEVPFGVTLRDFLRLVGGENAIGVQMGGPSGRMVPPAEFDRKICYDDLATGGSVMVFGPERNPVDVVRQFMEFFVDESCGYCTPCRVGNVLMKNKLDDLVAGRGEKEDLDYLQQLGATVKLTSRCGLGQTSPNLVLNTIAAFRPAYEALVKPKEYAELHASFDIHAALKEAKELAGRDSEIYDARGERTGEHR